MANFSTPKLAQVPRIANLLTLVFLAGTTWWSSAQRPLAHDTTALMTARAGAPSGQQTTNKPSQLPVDNPAASARQTVSPGVAGDNIITVGFSGASLR